jgi:transposase-like protein
VPVDHAPSPRGVVQDRPLLAAAFPHRQPPGWVSGRRAATSGTVKGKGRSWSRAVDQHGHPMAFLRTEHREKAAALQCLKQASRRHGVPEQIPRDGSAAHEAARQGYNEAHGTTRSMRQGQ